jgi:hypothetical protein
LAPGQKILSSYESLFENLFSDETFWIFENTIAKSGSKAKIE